MKSMKGTGNRKKTRAALRRRRRQRRIRVGFALLFILLAVLGGFRIWERMTERYVEKSGDWIDNAKPEMDVELLTVNPYSRPGTETNKINGIVVHYTANPGATAMENRNYFEGLKDSHETKASSNFIVGLEGEIVQCVPTWEVAYASNSRNQDTVSIECCHPDEEGGFTDETYQSAVDLCAWLCLKFDLDETDMIRHYDITGKICPKYYVEHEEAWDGMKQDVKVKLDEYRKKAKK